MGALLSLGARAAAQTSEPYPELDHIQGTLIQTAAAPVRPMLIDGNFNLWAVNTGLSTVERFVVGIQTPIEIRQVPWGPVSIAEWDDPDPEVGPELLVVCRNTWGVLRMDRESGALKEFIPLPAEPSDIVIDSDEHRALVSCTGADAVVRIDLEERDGRFHARYDEATTQGRLRLKSPYFLSLDPASGRVRVAPLHSGNNTTATGLGFANTDRVIDLGADGRTNQLPDEDLFEIDPSLSPSHVDAVQVIATGVGTILFSHGFDPGGGRYWVLNTNARNADPAAQSEPDLAFDFVDNRVTILQSSGATVAGFDPDSPGFSEDNGIGQPFALAFHPGNGRALVAGLLTDNVTLFSGAGTRLALTGNEVSEGCIRLPEGSIPRGIALVPGSPSTFAVYCWGTARIEAYVINHGGLLVTRPVMTTYFLSHDPLPEDLREGRRIFFDGHRSDRGNVSCASCHVDGGSDFLAWNLSGMPYDDKGPMVTQTLVGLERVSPFHWRGERTFEDFNSFAFPGLLGHRDPGGTLAPLSEEDFELMKAWLFSLRNPANPFQDRRRVVESAQPSSDFVAPTQTKTFRSVLPADLPLTHPLRAGTTVPASLSATDGVNGLQRFTGEPSFQGRFACSECHSFPVGTNNDVTDDEGQGAPVLPERLHFKNAPFHEMWRKTQSLVLADTQEPGQGQFIDARTFLGTGVAHAGKVADIARFVQPVLPLDPEFVGDVAAFMQQFDQGLAPAAHFAYWLDAASTPSESQEELVDFLLAQASSAVNADGMPNCDIAILQATEAGSPRAWYLDRSLAPTSLLVGSSVFVVDSDSAPDTRSMQDFIDEADSVPSLVVGLPVGMAERFAVDFDMDGRKNRSDALPFTVNPAPDSVPPQVRAKLGYVTTNSARLFVETDEPTTLEVDYREQGTLDVRTLTSPMLSRLHALLLTGLRPSTDVSVPVPYSNESVAYDVLEIRATDAIGTNTTSFDPDLAVETRPFTVPTTDGQPFNADIAQIVREHVMSEPPSVVVGPPNALGRRLVTVELASAYKQGAGTVQAESRVFVVRAFRVRGGGSPVQLTVGNGLLSTISGSGTRFVQSVVASASASDQRALGLSGSLIVPTVPTDTSGIATLQFRVTSPMVQAGDEVVISVEAILEGTAVAFTGCTGFTCATAEVTVAKVTAISQWDFPRTKEINFLGRATAN